MVAKTIARLIYVLTEKSAARRAISRFLALGLCLFPLGFVRLMRAALMPLAVMPLGNGAREMLQRRPEAAVIG